jgi:hypothetical protein
MLTDLAAECLLEYVPRKEFLLQLPAAGRSPAQDLFSYRPQIHPKTGFEYTVIHIGGVPVGLPEAISEYCLLAASKYQQHLSRLVSCPLPVSYIGVILMYAARPQCLLNHYIRAVQPSLTLAASQAADDFFFESLAALLTVDAAEFSRDDTGKWASRRQAQLAVRDGGCAFSSLEALRPAAYL